MAAPAQRSAFAAAEDMLHLMVDAVEDYAIYLLDARGQVLSWNTGAQRITGYTAAEALGLEYARFFTPEDIAAGEPQHHLEEARRRDRYREEGWRQRKDGTRFWADITLTALRDASGRIIGFAKITRDLTVRRRQEDALRAAKEQAETANLAKSEFLANMSHELRTPLNAILGFAELLGNETFGSLSSDQNRDYVRHIHTSGMHLLALINDILDMSKLDASSLTLDLRETDLCAVANDAITLMAPEAAQSGVVLKVKRECPAPLLCDQRRVQQILFNLLSNAIKFTPSGGTVWVDIAEDEHWVILRVEDNGIGMSAEDLPKAMTRFGQIESGYARKYQGTGLGLPLVKHLAELHGGAFTLTSDLGVGTVAIVRLPAKARESTGPASPLP